VFPEVQIAEKFWGFKRFGEIKGIGEVENHFESQPHDVRTQGEHLIASTQKKNTLESLIKRPDKTGSFLIKSHIS
jgi:hypothetical protein